MTDILHDAHDYDGHSRSVRLSSDASLNGIKQLTARFSGPMVTLTRMDSEKKPKRFVLNATELVDLYTALQGYHAACDAYYVEERRKMDEMLTQAKDDAQVFGGVITDIREVEGYHIGTMYYAGTLTFTGEWGYMSMREGVSIYKIIERLDEIKGILAHRETVQKARETA